MNHDLDFWKGWGKRLKDHLKKHDQSLAKLAEKMVDEEGKPMTEGALRHWTNGTRNPKLAQFMELCLKAGADPAQILFGRPLMRPDIQKQVAELANTIAEPDPTYERMMRNVDAGTRKGKLQYEAGHPREPATVGARRGRKN